MIGIEKAGACFDQNCAVYQHYYDKVLKLLLEQHGRPFCHRACERETKRLPLVHHDALNSNGIVCRLHEMSTPFFPLQRDNLQAKAEKLPSPLLRIQVNHTRVCWA
jgi:hypothetical protein